MGTSIGHESSVWFTISHGILNEIYFPRVDQACTRDLGLVVTGPDGFFAEEKRHTAHSITTLVDGIPAFAIVNRCLRDHFEISKEIIVDPRRPVVLQRIRFASLIGASGAYRVYALLAPHLGNAGKGNTAWCSDFNGVPMHFAQRDGVALAMACSMGWRARSVGFVGVSDGWQLLQRDGELTEYARAANGNVAITGEIDRTGTGECTIAVGFGSTAAEAGHRALASMYDGFEHALHEYIGRWRRWHRQLRPPTHPSSIGRDLFRTSAAVLRTHESAQFPGGIIASLSLPWGATMGDGDLGGYHLVWPRDLVESAGGLLAAGATRDARRVLDYLTVTQGADGNWPQNMWIEGAPYWNGIQMDETAFPILLVELAQRLGAVGAASTARYWPMVRRAASYLVRNGPVTDQDRWEEEPGYSPFTLAVEVAALLVAAELADTYEPAIATYLRETADAWNDAIETWTFARETPLARALGIPGYYVRIAPPNDANGASPTDGAVRIRNRLPADALQIASSIVSPDALALVRFGLRSADDARIVATVAAIDHALRVDLPQGPAWRRYNGDGYGEHGDGAPFDGVGIGRPWPLLTGERAHYELAAGRIDEARRLLAAYELFANTGGLFPEQVWDGEDLPERELYRGRPTGSAMPLAWAHAEYLKLRRALAEGRPIDTPPQPVARYQQARHEPAYHPWRFNLKRRDIPAGRRLRIELRAAATVHWSDDGWTTIHDTSTTDTGLGIHVADLDTMALSPGRVIDFTIRWSAHDRWEGSDHSVVVVDMTISPVPLQDGPIT